MLSRLIGHPSGEANWRVSPWEPPPLLRNPEPEWIKAALEHRPEIQSKRWELSALGAERKLAWFAPFEGLETGAESERDAEWSVGPSISSPIPIFDFGQARRDELDLKRGGWSDEARDGLKAAFSAAVMSRFYGTEPDEADLRREFPALFARGNAAAATAGLDNESWLVQIGWKADVAPFRGLGGAVGSFGVRVSSAPKTVGRPTARAASAKRTMPYRPS